jgi:hypothetical protein
MFALLQQEAVIVVVIGLLILARSQLPKLVRSLADRPDQPVTADPGHDTAPSDDA